MWPAGRLWSTRLVVSHTGRKLHCAAVASRLAALTAAGAALVVVGSITVGLPFAMGAQARTPGGRCAARFPEVIRDGFPEPAMRFSAHGQLRTTLRGDDIVPRFLEILEEYVALRYPEVVAATPS